MFGAPSWRYTMLKIPAPYVSSMKRDIADLYKPTQNDCKSDVHVRAHTRTEPKSDLGMCEGVFIYCQIYSSYHFP